MFCRTFADYSLPSVFPIEHHLLGYRKLACQSRSGSWRGMLSTCVFSTRLVFHLIRYFCSLKPRVPARRIATVHRINATKRMASAWVRICRYYIFTCLVSCSHRLLIFHVPQPSIFCIQRPTTIAAGNGYAHLKREGRDVKGGTVEAITIVGWHVSVAGSFWLVCRDPHLGWKALFSSPSKVCKLHGAQYIVAHAKVVFI